MATYLSNDGFFPSSAQPVDPNAPTTSTIPEAWAWLVQNQSGYTKGRKDTAKYFVTDTGYSVTKEGIPALIIPDANGNITKDSWIPEYQFVQNMMSMPVASRKVLQQKLKSAGFLGKDFNANGMLDPDGAFIQQALMAQRTASAQNLAIAKDPEAYGATAPLDIDTYLNKMIKSGESGYSSTSVSKSFTSFTEAESRGILENFYAEALGRRPSDAEVKKFSKTINNAAKAAPSTSTTTYGTNTTATTQKEGYTQADAELEARTLAESQPESNAFLTSTKYMDAFMSVLGGRVSGV